MKQIYICALLGALLAAGLTGCVRTAEVQPSLSPQAYTEKYRSAISGARDQDSNDAFPLVTDPQAPLADVIFSMLGVSPEDMAAYALSVSPMNTQAYAVAAVLPAAGREDAVTAALNGFIAQQKQNFDQYLIDQYQIADRARLERLADGTVLLVMCRDQDAVFEAIRDNILL